MEVSVDCLKYSLNDRRAFPFPPLTVYPFRNTASEPCLFASDHRAKVAMPLVRHQNGIDYVNDAIRLANVRDGHLRFDAFFIRQNERLSVHRCPQLAASDGRQLRLAVAR